MPFDRRADPGTGTDHAPTSLACGNIPKTGAEEHFGFVSDTRDLLNAQAAPKKVVYGRQGGKQRRGREPEACTYGKPAHRDNINLNPDSIECGTKGWGVMGCFVGYTILPGFFNENRACSCGPDGSGHSGIDHDASADASRCSQIGAVNPPEITGDVPGAERGYRCGFHGNEMFTGKNWV
jgi:hypothetical protein